MSDMDTKVDVSPELKQWWSNRRKEYRKRYHPYGRNTVPMYKNSMEQKPPRIEKSYIAKYPLKISYALSPKFNKLPLPLKVSNTYDELLEYFDDPRRASIPGITS